jgi:GTP:adenosylcobinamide-phosphate guanylyltransferase
MNNNKSVVAILLAGGITDDFRAGAVPKPKALLPVCGQPIANYVILALEESHVEKIFVIQDEGVHLQASLSNTPKCVFYCKDKGNNSYSLSMRFGLEKVAEFYGYPQIKQKLIMTVPCDIPLVTRDNFNALIEKAKTKNTDFTLAIIAENLVKKRFPHIHMRSFYLDDYKDRYTLQMIGFTNGELLLYEPDQAPGKARLSFRGVDEERVTKVKETVDTVRDHRHHDFRLPRFTDKFAIRWLIRKEFMIYILKFLFNLISNRLTMAKISEYFNGVLQVNTGFIVSEEVEISADIDRPEDFPVVMGIPYDKRSLF